ncbi:M56 family metallopeptidase [Streptomyces sp. AcE210]|uniref:M56 family metallopeptidase n=1 Tax=Streptomyces sp. AcE210 TaxID=2292703 RepID=UPI000E30788D|nr:M56 family metallopeptidase [Streptomyces sp. AcE210]RFC73174.1 M56 family peptidase [Streptomyces sp. AcE210]
MIFAVWIPLIVPLLAVPAARRAAEWLPPRAAAWTLAGFSVVLAGSSTAALGLLASAGALRLPPVAALGHLSPPLLGDGSPVLVPASVLAALALAAGAFALVRTGLRQRRELRAARAGAAADELSVRADELPYAYALPGRPGRIVVTTGMLRALDAREREVLFAHERAHLAGRHHLFLAMAELAVTLHPMLRGLREPLAYALERWADESAATATGDRALTARAIGRAALAAARFPGAGSRPRTALAVTAGPVPRRVAALLTTSAAARPRRALRRALAGALLVCAALSAGAVADAAHDLHAGVEVAQGETGH